MELSKVFAALTAYTLLVSPSFAAGTPLPAGKPAGSQQATLLGPTLSSLASLGLAAVGIAFALGAFKSKSTSTTGTSS